MKQYTLFHLYKELQQRVMSSNKWKYGKEKYELSKGHFYGRPVDCGIEFVRIEHILELAAAKKKWYIGR